jgi:glycosyltransferase involved in cell wall biosynthesis
MNIALDCERMKYAHTGLFEYCQQLGNALKVCKGPTDQISFYLNPNLQQHFGPTDRFIDQHSLQKFIFPRLPHIDLWHTTYQLSRYIPHSRKIKRVITIHDLNFLYEGKSPSKIKKYLDKHQKNIDLCDHIIAISNFTKNDVLDHLKIGEKPISVVYNGCAEPPLLTSNPAYAPKNPFLFSLGTVNPKKNFHVLVPLLKGNDLELIIAGKTEPAYVDQILQEARKHGVEQRVKITGPITEQEKHWYYKNCEAFLFPSLAEGFGIPPIEAMQYGKPVFLSRATSLPEIGGCYAYYFNHFDPEDMQHAFVSGMSHYLENQPQEAIIAHAKQFNWTGSARAYLRIYKETLVNR